MSAGSRVAHTFELLESILLMLAETEDLCAPGFRGCYNNDEAQLRLRTVLLSQRVSEVFQQTIASSKSLQEALFFKTKAFNPARWQITQHNPLRPTKQRPYGALKLGYEACVVNWGRQKSEICPMMTMRISFQKNEGSALRQNPSITPSWMRMYWWNAPFQVVELQGHNYSNPNVGFFSREERCSPTFGELYEAVIGGAQRTRDPEQDFEEQSLLAVRAFRYTRASHTTRNSAESNGSRNVVLLHNFIHKSSRSRLLLHTHHYPLTDLLSSSHFLDCAQTYFTCWLVEALQFFYYSHPISLAKVISNATIAASSTGNQAAAIPDLLEQILLALSSRGRPVTRFIASGSSGSRYRAVVEWYENLQGNDGVKNSLERQGSGVLIIPVSAQD
ncbi:uncharacterized protein MYCFIDRAFT_199729 [Pseudocercospora fijiensis CIRAD86]|uniref:Uncharacterized protein n=1 Tax=Pseudocercospora fijiensis (strain CIRAD86) TaxID=383855 RepID=M2YLC9_PSEFD|nr:uncharacterized protein MYCFIDRAFT_199729 [Pseudocercospora fijiensis CIRAD86]EME78550.1 hypothetical protein MYCFIDRAFT_199729 [Pseudocercospora fijiensis CIRAD86]